MPLVADQRLRKLGHSLRDVDEVEHHAPLGAHDQVEVAQADVEVDERHLLAGLRQRRPESGRRGRLADASLARGDDHYLAHVASPILF